MKEKKPVYTIDWRRAKFAIAGVIIAAIILGFVLIKGLIV